MRAMLVLVAAMLPLPLAAESPECGAAAEAAWREGFSAGVEAVNAQLGAVTAQIQADVQGQVNAQLARIEADRAGALEARLAEAQAQALAAQGPVAAPAGMPALPPLARHPGGGIAPAAPPAPEALPPGSTITITDPQNLPPELFRALMDYADR
ncbi:MAG TPA: hypothetical protein PKA35_00715 [Paracoccus solventivorans]|uniref:hypothetical protein n=1 Tax=Paracoccus solventivorans TaxID=53463 RepID=UPI002C668F76|nr:hypothetical protein [Paracoccus solventivorans]HMM07620.1 hypothetical protein [Paracoccus solventivorans]